MKHIHFDVESDGFYGAYWACKDGSDCTVIAMLGDDPDDYMARSAVKWLIRQGMANGGRITLFLQGKALTIHAALLSAP